jgi:hypothetical protein
MLKRRNMQLDSYVCELCIHQSEEKLGHLFFKCPFAKNCWAAIGIHVPTFKSKSSHEKDQKINQQAFRNGSDNINVMLYLE